MSDQTYEQLMLQIEQLKQQAEVVRRQEISEAIADVKAKIVRFNLTPSDVGFSANDFPGRRSGSTKAKSSAKAKVRIPPGKYRNPATGEIKDVGSAGRKPGWLVAMSADELAKCRV